MPPEKTTINVIEHWPVIGPIMLFLLTAAGTFWAKLSGKASREELMVMTNKLYDRINEVDKSQRERLDSVMAHAEDQRAALERHIQDMLWKHAKFPNKREADKQDDKE